jgi:hypothetical protein
MINLHLILLISILVFEGPRLIYFFLVETKQALKRRLDVPVQSEHLQLRLVLQPERILMHVNPCYHQLDRVQKQ